MKRKLIDRHSQTEQLLGHVITKDNTLRRSELKHALSSFESRILCMRAVKNIKKALLCISISLILTVTIDIGHALSMSDQDIFDWVAPKLKIKTKYPMPKILVVSKKELQSEFKKESEGSYQRWIEIYGENTAKKTMDMYLSEVIGLFNPKSKVIYVGSFMEPCKFKSIVAHEITHYLQIMDNGSVEPGSILFDNVHFFRELQANGIAEDFVKTFCGPWGRPWTFETLLKLQNSSSPQDDTSRLIAVTTDAH